MKKITCLLLLLISSLTHCIPLRAPRDATTAPPDENTDQHSCERLNNHNDLISQSLSLIPHESKQVTVPLPDGNKYVYDITVCWKDFSVVDGIPNCAIKQTKKDNSESNLFERCLGRTSQMQLAPSSKQTELVDWAEVWFFNGSKYHTHCDKAERSARIVFVCDRSKGNTINYKFIEEDVESRVLCSYLFLAETAAVCTPQAASSIGGFWIFVLVLLGVIAIIVLVFVAGIAIKRFAMGAKGWEQVPCIGMWRFVGNLAADGCDFCCRCGGRHPTMPTYLPGKLSGSTGNKFGVESSDEETDPPREDEQILPM